MTGRRNASVSTLCTAIALAAAACAPDPAYVERPPIVWEGARLRFGTDLDTARLCAGTFEHIDAVAEHLVQALGLDPDDAPIVDYYWVGEGIDRYCSIGGLLGCTKPATDEVFSRHPVHQHELVHVLRDGDTAYPPLEEGLAEYYGDRRFETPFPVLGDEVELFESHDGETRLRNSPRWYGRAGHFVSFLASRYGTEALLELTHRSRDGASWDKTRALFGTVLGESFDDIVSARQAEYPDCEQNYYRNNDFECDAAVVYEIPPEPSADPASPTTSFEVSAECDSPRVIGPSFDEQSTIVALEFAEAGHYRFNVWRLGSDDGFVRFSRCGQDCADAAVDDALDHYFALQEKPDSTPASTFIAEACVQPGRYLLSLSAPEGASGAFLVEFARDAEGDGDCP